MDIIPAIDFAESIAGIFFVVPFSVEESHATGFFC
jgi:hypothetical protein